MIGIIAYGSGNVKAIANIYKRLNLDYFITSDPGKLKEATRLILPGVGAFDQTMNLLNESGLRSVLDKLVLNDKIPVLGICVGMQIMAESSEEGAEKGLGWISGRVKKIDQNKLHNKPKLPHMGWNSVILAKPNEIVEDVNFNKGFYFLHSYFMSPSNEEDVLVKADYGQEFACVVKKENVVGIQFHPEKSHDNGIQVFKNFANI
ncbi:imidazole glycerol phosphate synthase subunit HisH [Roseivirga sp.]|uniref:imidazole glycerol phosphate synthase subunit HisH n=1 Tax=Roseivirga sp. TaxID=1964215 RepID=UPI003B525591